MGNGPKEVHAKIDGAQQAFDMKDGVDDESAAGINDELIFTRVDDFQDWMWKLDIDNVYGENTDAILTSDLNNVLSIFIDYLKNSINVDGFEKKLADKLTAIEAELGRFDEFPESDEDIETSGKIYTVKKGDTLSAIVLKKFSRTKGDKTLMWKYINALNETRGGGDVNVIAIGEKLNLDEAAMAVRSDASQTASRNSGEGKQVDPVPSTSPKAATEVVSTGGGFKVNLDAYDTLENYETEKDRILTHLKQTYGVDLLFNFNGSGTKTGRKKDLLALRIMAVGLKEANKRLGGNLRQAFSKVDRINFVEEGRSVNFSRGDGPISLDIFLGWQTTENIQKAAEFLLNAESYSQKRMKGLNNATSVHFNGFDGDAKSFAVWASDSQSFQSFPRGVERALDFYGKNTLLDNLLKQDGVKLLVSPGTTPNPPYRLSHDGEVVIVLGQDFTGGNQNRIVSQLDRLAKGEGDFGEILEGLDGKITDILGVSPNLSMVGDNYIDVLGNFGNIYAAFSALRLNPKRMQALKNTSISLTNVPGFRGDTSRLLRGIVGGRGEREKIEIDYRDDPSDIARYIERELDAYSRKNV